ncbi:hypothetical protein DNTS_035636 [Danionella cerebrum]|uniref:Uncharacterized protein n=1 Tax=Danionella cerebrum TaxID=2873325 RepID=A0A553R9F6_9TELE|nr:hypothetical protein DNTS_035636 [Danionella translucida]
MQMKCTTPKRMVVQVRREEESRWPPPVTSKAGRGELCYLTMLEREERKPAVTEDQQKPRGRLLIFPQEREERTREPHGSLVRKRARHLMRASLVCVDCSTARLLGDGDVEELDSGEES